MLASSATKPHLSKKKKITKRQKRSPTSMDILVHLPFCSNVKTGILPLGNNRVGVRVFMARVLMKILETKGGRMKEASTGN
jgi:hypothetical protein